MQTRSLLPEPPVSSRFSWLALIALLVSGGLILFINQLTQIDQRLANLHFDTALNDFPWRKRWFATTLIDGRGKYVVVGFGLLALAITLNDATRPTKRMPLLTRLQLRIVSLTMTLVPLSVAILSRIRTFIVHGRSTATATANPCSACSIRFYAAGMPDSASQALTPAPPYGWRHWPCSDCRGSRNAPSLSFSAASAPGSFSAGSGKCVEPTF